MKIGRVFPLENESVTQTLNSVMDEQQNTIEVTTTSDLAARVATSKETKVYEPRPLTPQDPVYDEVMEQFGARPVKPKYWFEEFGDYWSCSCGHINSGPTCEGCGLERDLLRKLFILHKPSDANSILSEEAVGSLQAKVPAAADTSDDLPGPPEGAPDPEEAGTSIQVRPKSQPVPASKDRLSGLRAMLKGRKKLLLAVIALLLLAGGGGGYYYSAIMSTDPDNVKVGSPVTFTDPGSYDEALSPLGELDSEIASDDFKRDSYIAIGDNCVKKGKYAKAVSAYKKAQDIKDGNDVLDKINSAKFEYVKAHSDEGGDHMASYLAELKKMGYPGINEIYDKYYAWHLRIVANGSESDFQTKKTSFHRSETVFFHISLSGGEPDEKIRLYYVATWPGGARETQNFNSEWKSGSKITAHFSYPVAMFGEEGKMTFKVFDSESNQEMGSCTVTFAD